MKGIPAVSTYINDNIMFNILSFFMVYKIVVCLTEDQTPQELLEVIKLTMVNIPGRYMFTG